MLIQGSRDQCSFDSFPGLIAVFHALPRLLAPRHPPHALSSLAALIVSSTVARREKITTNYWPLTDDLNQGQSNDPYFSLRALTETQQKLQHRHGSDLHLAVPVCALVSATLTATELSKNKTAPKARERHSRPRFSEDNSWKKSLMHPSRSAAAR